MYHFLLEVFTYPKMLHTENTDRIQLHFYWICSVTVGRITFQPQNTFIYWSLTLQLTHVLNFTPKSTVTYWFTCTRFEGIIKDICVVSGERVSLCAVVIFTHRKSLVLDTLTFTLRTISCPPGMKPNGRDWQKDLGKSQSPFQALQGPGRKSANSPPQPHAGTLALSVTKIILFYSYPSIIVKMKQSYLEEYSCCKRTLYAVSFPYNIFSNRRPKQTMHFHQCHYCPKPWEHKPVMVWWQDFIHMQSTPNSKNLSPLQENAAEKCHIPPLQYPSLYPHLNRYDLPFTHQRLLVSKPENCHPFLAWRSTNMQLCFGKTAKAPSIYPLLLCQTADACAGVWLTLLPTSEGKVNATVIDLPLDHHLHQLYMVLF